MYFAQGNKIFLRNNKEGHELFLTVHLTKDSTKTIIEQAEIIARILNTNT